MQPAELTRLTQLLRSGGVVGCPTETLMGLLADARDPIALAEVCRLKGRDPMQPIGLLLPDLQALDAWITDFPAAARALAARHWPGPLTLVLRARPGLPASLVRAGKLAVRVPGPSPALELVRAFGSPLTATSANQTGQPPTRTAAEVRAVFGDQLAAIVQGSAPGGAPSTLVDASGTEPRVLRAGALSHTELGLPAAPAERAAR